MKILHLTGDNEDAGGVLSVIRNLQESGSEQGWFLQTWVNDKYEEKRQPKLTYVRSRHACGEWGGHAQIFLNAFRSFFELRGVLSRQPVDILHAHTRGGLLVGCLLARFCGKRVVFSSHSYARSVGMYRWLFKHWGLYSSMVTENMVKYYGLELKYPRISVVSDCYSDRLLALAVKPGDSISKPLVTFIGVGSMLGWKKWDLLIKAVALLHPAKQKKLQINIWGPTLLFPESQVFERCLRGMISEFGLQNQIKLCGSTSDLPDRLRHSDWFVLPSTNEPCSVALLEAMAMGVPALVSRSGGCVDIVQDGATGLFFAPDDARDLARRLEQIVDGHHDVKGPEQVRESVRSRSASCVAREYNALYKAILKC